LVVEKSARLWLDHKRGPIVDYFRERLSGVLEKLFVVVDVSDYCLEFLLMAGPSVADRLDFFDEPDAS